MKFEDLIDQWARSARIANWQQVAKNNKHRCVYVLECRGSYKVGMTGDLPKRMKTIQSGNPFQITLAHVIFTEDHYKLEQSLHRIFAESREGNEWFNLSARDLAVIKSMSVAQILGAAEALKPNAEPQPQDVDPNQMKFDW
jgi:hypothetical protein